MAGSVVLAWVWFASDGALGAIMLWHLLFNFATANEAMQGLCICRMWTTTPTGIGTPATGASAGVR